MTALRRWPRRSRSSLPFSQGPLRLAARSAALRPIPLRSESDRSRSRFSSAPPPFCRRLQGGRQALLAGDADLLFAVVDFDVQLFHVLEQRLEGGAIEFREIEIEAALAHLARR